MADVSCVGVEDFCELEPIDIGCVVVVQLTGCMGSDVSDDV